MRRRLIVTFVFCALAACFIAACANAVVVQPSNMNGWVTTTQVPAMSKLRDPAPPNESGGLEHSGTGAWYCYTGTTDASNPVQGNAWIGTNQFNGTQLSDITTLKYLAWTDDSGHWSTRTAPGSTYLGRQLNSSRHCVVLNIVIDLDPVNYPGDPAYQRYLMLRPFGTKNQGMPGSSCERYFGGMYRHWWPVDGIATQKWLEIYPTATMNVWDWVIGADLGCQTWAEVVAAHPGAAIAASATTGSVWPGNSNVIDVPTGCSLNLMYGAEHRSGNTNMNAAHPLHTAWNTWWRDAYAMRAFMDDFTIGIGYNDTLFDFEADAASPEKVVTTKGARDRETCGVGTNVSQAGAYVRGREYGSYNDTTFVMVGTVCAADGNGEYGPGTKSFYIDDGYKKTEVVCVSHTFGTPGVVVRVKGFLQIDYGQFVDDTGAEYTGGDPAPIAPDTANIHPRILATNDNIIELYP